MTEKEEKNFLFSMTFYKNILIKKISPCKNKAKLFLIIYRSTILSNWLVYLNNHKYSIKEFSSLTSLVKNLKYLFLNDFEYADFENYFS